MEFPQRFGKYTLLKRLATGGMAEIFLARQRGMGGFEKEVVVKRLLPLHADNQDLVTMFLDEARVAAHLTHPNIAQIYDLGRAEEDFYFIAMEYVRGQDLRRLCAKGIAEDNYLPMHHAVRIIAEVCDALAYAHSCSDADGQPLGIVHRDVSPTNILITYEGGVKLVDFGIAKASTQAAVTKAGQIKGKFGYMAPEQVSGSELDSRTDLFAVGINLYEIALGRRLFRGETEVDTLRAIEVCDIPAPREVEPRFPEGLERIIMRALAQRREDRYATARDMQMALEDFLAGEGLRSTAGMLAEYMRHLFRDQLELESEETARLRELAKALPPEDSLVHHLKTTPLVSGGVGSANAAGASAAEEAQDAAGAADEAGRSAAAGGGAETAGGGGTETAGGGAVAADPDDDGSGAEGREVVPKADATLADATLAEMSAVDEAPGELTLADLTLSKGPPADVAPADASPVPAPSANAPEAGEAPARAAPSQAAPSQAAQTDDSRADASPEDASAAGRDAAPTRPDEVPSPESEPAPVAGPQSAASSPRSASAPADSWSGLNTLPTPPPLASSSTPAPTFSPRDEEVVLLDDPSLDRPPRSYTGLLLLLLLAVGAFGVYQLMATDLLSGLLPEAENRLLVPQSKRLQDTVPAPEEPVEAAPAPRTLLRMRSEPPGARVVVNGNILGSVTPTAVQALSGRFADVRFLMPGFLPVESRVLIEGDEQDLVFTLEEGRPPVGKLYVESHPPGCTVTLNGQELGVTPLDLPAVAADAELVLRFTKEGFYPHVAIYRVPADQQGTVGVRLVPDVGPRKAVEVTVESIPIGAMISRVGADGAAERVGRTDRFGIKINSMMDAHLALRAEASRRGTVEASLDLKEPFYTVIMRMPEPTRLYGTFSILGQRGLTVFIGPTEVGKTPVTDYKLETGAHTVVVMDEKTRQRVEFNIEVNKDQTVEKSAVIEDEKIVIR